MKKRYISTKNWSREKWLKARENTLGGSDAGTLLGYNPYSCKAALWHQKAGLEQKIDKPTLPKIVGRVLEDLVADLWSSYEEDEDPKIAQERTLYNYEAGKKLRECIKTDRIILHKDYDFLAANVDREWIHNKQRRVLECKTISGQASKMYEGGLPPGYYAQTQFYIWIDDFEYAEVPMLIDKDRFIVYRFERDNELIAKLEEEAKDLWARVIGAREALKHGMSREEVIYRFEPNSEDTEAYESFKKQTYKEGTITREGEWTDYQLGLKYKSICKDIKLLGNDKLAISNHFRELMSKEQIAELNFFKGGKITYKATKKGTPVLNISIKEL